MAVYVCNYTEDITIAAPVLSITSNAQDFTPEFALLGELFEGDTVHFQYANEVDFSDATDVTNTIDSSEDTADELVFATGALAQLQWYFRARIERGAGESDWSNVVDIILSSNELELTAWTDAVEAAGGSVTLTQAGRVNEVIVALKAAGTWALIDRLWLYAGESDPFQAQIDIKSLESHTLVSTPALDVGGYLGNGSSHAIDTEFSLQGTITGRNWGSTASGSVGASMGAYVTGASTAGILAGNHNAAEATLVVNPAGWRGVIDKSAHEVSTQPTVGFIAHTVNTANNRLYKNGSLLLAGTPGAPNLDFGGTGPNSEIFVLARRYSATDNWSNAKVGAFYLGGYLDSTQMAVTYFALDTYMAAWGVDA